MQKLTTQQFIEMAKRLHSQKYDYSNVNYISSLEKVRITCPQHGDFDQTPNNHLKKSGCPKCAILKRSKGGAK